jgi:hypothetical protein
VGEYKYASENSCFGIFITHSLTISTPGALLKIFQGGLVVDPILQILEINYEDHGKGYV